MGLGVYMENNNYLSLDSSLLNRYCSKYFDKVLENYGFGYGQLFFLLQIYENPGISMHDLSRLGDFDKGTVTKSVQKLLDLDYIKSVVNEEDKRQKFLYTTSKADNIMHDIYLAKQIWWEHLFKNLSDEERDTYVYLQNKIIDQARIGIGDYRKVNIYGFQKLSLVDYPGNMTAVLFTGGCNFKCPFCHNRELVFLNEKANVISHDDIFAYLNKRSKILEAVCISGGEPLLQDGIVEFIEKIKELGFKVKLDTNGTNYTKLKYLIEHHLVDYVAMDIKNSKDKYALTADVSNIDINVINDSIKLLIDSDIDYEFRTTVVSEFHELHDFKQISKWLKGAKNYYLQAFNDCPNVIRQGLHSPSLEFLEEAKKLLTNNISNVYIRGVD